MAIKLSQMRRNLDQRGAALVGMALIVPLPLLRSMVPGGNGSQRHKVQRPSSGSDVRNLARHRVRRNEQGVALVEFALVLPLLMILLLGTISGAQAYDKRLQLTHAVREGARYAATVPADQVFLGGGTWASNVQQLIVDRSTGDLTLGQVCVALVEGSGGTLSVVATPNPATSYSTGRAAAPGVSAIAAGQPCIPGETYPLTASDNGRRVQVTAHNPESIELLFDDIFVMLKGQATAKSETNS